MLQPDLDARTCRTVADDRGRVLRIGLVCPYSLDVPGGVQSHVLDLAARTLRGHSGHHVEVPRAGRTASRRCPRSSRPPGRAVRVPYNGSVARVSSARCPTPGCAAGSPSTPSTSLHLHEPATVSLSSLALIGPRGRSSRPSTPRPSGRARSLAFGGPVMRPLMEKVTARIAVSPTCPPRAGRAPRRRRRDHPERRRRGALRRVARRCPGYPRATGPRSASSAGSTSRARACRCCSRRCALLVRSARTCGCSSPAAATPDALRRAGRRRPRASALDLLGGVDEATKAALLRSVDVYCAPNLAARASASCSSRRWPRARRSWPATSTPSRRCWSDGDAGVLVRAATGRYPAGACAAGARPLARLGRAARRPAAPGRPRRRGAGPRGRVRLAGGRRGRCCGSTARPSPPTRRRVPGRTVASAGDGTRPRRAGARAHAHGWAIVVVALLLVAVVTWSCVVAGPPAGPAAPADRRRPRRVGGALDRRGDTRLQVAARWPRRPAARRVRPRCADRGAAPAPPRGTTRRRADGRRDSRARRESRLDPRGCGERPRPPARRPRPRRCPPGLRGRARRRRAVRRARPPRAQRRRARHPAPAVPPARALAAAAGTAPPPRYFEIADPSWATGPRSSAPAAAGTATGPTG